MGIRKAIGLGMTIIILKFLTPHLFGSIESTVTTLFTRADEIISSTEFDTRLAAPTVPGLSD